MKKSICFILIVILVLSILGTVYAEDAIEEVVPDEVQEALEETETEETIYTLYELLPFKNDNWSFSSHFGFDLYSEEEFELFYEYADKIKLVKYDGVVVKADEQALSA